MRIALTVVRVHRSVAIEEEKGGGEEENVGKNHKGIYFKCHIYFFVLHDRARVREEVGDDG